MLEFLKECNKFHMYERAMSCEATIKDFNVIIPMAIFFETTFKAIYCELYPKADIKDVEKANFHDLLEEIAFRDYVKKQYNLKDKDWSQIKSTIRIGSNKYKHKLKIENILTAKDIKESFKCLYDFAAQYYALKTKKPRPEWQEEEYTELLKRAVDISAREKKEAELKDKIEKLEKQIKEDKEDRISALKEVERLEKELEAARYSNIDPVEFETLQSHISLLSAEIDKNQSNIIILKSKAKIAEENRKKAETELKYTQDKLSITNSIKSDEMEQLKAELEGKYQEACDIVNSLSSENATLLRNIDAIRLKQEEYQRQLEEAGNKTADAKLMESLESSLREAELRRASSEKQLEYTDSQLKSIQEKLKFSSDEIDLLTRKWMDERKEKEALYIKQGELIAANEELESLITAVNGPRCHICNSVLTPKVSKFGEGNYFWACPGWRGGSGCTAKTRPVSDAERPIAVRILDMISSKGENWEQFNMFKQEITAKNKTTLFSLSKASIDKHKRKTINYVGYPYSLEVGLPTTYIFQSIAVPEEVFETREEFGVKAFSKFRMYCEMDKMPVPERERTIYSMILRLLTRGIVLPSNARTSDVLREKFNKKNLGKINALFDYIKYSSPCNEYGSDTEKLFAEFYFPRLLGESWATYVFSQIGFDVLVPDNGDVFKDQRVDFLLTKGGKQIVIEIDGPEHKHYGESDRSRDDFLRNHGYLVFRFTNNAVEMFDENIFNVLSSEIGSKNIKVKDTEVDDRYLVACKLIHQFSIAIAKALEQGYIGNIANIKATADTAIFTESEIQLILTLAIADVHDILVNYATIYNLETEWNLLDSREPIIKISIGDGSYMDKQSITLRDCYLRHDYMCNIEKFDDNVVPVNCDLPALEFFLEYLFGHKHFREGQYAAISKLLMQKDSIVLLPTGAGKSIIYQLSCYIVPGIIIVISPLTSLIEDQIINLELKNGINNALSITSAITELDRVKKEHALEYMQKNSTSMLYISPERLQIPSFRKNISGMMANNNVFAVAIDEAHCVSEWGHDFRPAYLNLGNSARNLFRKNDRSPALVALTGTASSAVLSDVQRDLKIMGADAITLPETFDRTELKFSVMSCPSEDKIIHLANIVKNELPGKFNCTYENFARLEGNKTNAGIVFAPYASSKRPGQYDVESIQRKLSDMLPEMGLASYFSKVPDGFDEASWKTSIREYARKFKKNDLNLLVATKAFGMGIDKENIRFIIHNGIPASFEQYYQEAGRAGRDRNPSECILLFSNDNEEENGEFLASSLSLEEFNTKYAEYIERDQSEAIRDDLSSVLFFHTNAFLGIDSECNVVNKILDILNEKELIPGKETYLSLQLEENEKKDRAEKRWLQAMVRLVTLGIITDYTYDYNRKFILTIGSIETTDIIKKYMEYTEAYDVGRKESEESKLTEIDKTGIEFAKDAVRVLTEYIYDNIERSRRRAVREMYMMAKDASDLQGEEQDSFIRKNILHYFSYKGENIDHIQKIASGKSAGLTELLNVFDFSPSKNIYNADEKQKARELSITAGRMLESKPDHPGLLFLQACASVITGNYNKVMIANDIVAAVQFAKTRYSVDASVLKPVLSKTLNLALSSSAELFDVTVESLERATGESKMDILDSLLLSEEINDGNRAYLLLSYTLERTNKFMEV